MRSDYLILALLWAIYCAAHSALISIKATGFFKRVLGQRYRFYRLFYNAFSLFTLILLLRYSQAPRFQGSLLLTWNGNWQFIKYALMFIAAALIISGGRHYSMSQFLGLQQIRSRVLHASLAASGELDTRGVLGLVRHPWYLAVFILLWAGDQNTGSVVIHAVLSVYLVIGTLLEERKLVIEFGDRYRQYQKRVSMLFPLKWLIG